jgi:mono/diheme cytochrome c family protein
MDLTRRLQVVVSSCIAVSLVALAAGAVGADGVRAEARVGASSGIYVEEQAEAGAIAFATHCAACHGEDLQGGFGPTLAPLDPWQFADAPLERLFDRMRTEMPFDAPGSLDVETYRDILTFVLRENGYPSGEEPLDSDEDAIARFVLDDPPAE